MRIEEYKNLVEGKSMLEEKVSLVTGGAGGIGSAIAKKFADLGSTVYINDVREASDLANIINSDGGKAIPIKADITDKNEVKKMFSRILQESRGVDILINNAAIYGEPPTNFQDLSYKNFKKILNVDLTGAVYCTIEAIKQMKDEGWGRIMFVAAPLSSSAIPCPYLAGKSGFIGMTKYLTKLENYGIKTFAVVLRHIYTPMLEKVMLSRGKDPKIAKKELDEKSLTGRMATPDEIANMFAYFALPTSDCMNGQTILADGGITYLR